MLLRSTDLLVWISNHFEIHKKIGVVVEISTTAMHLFTQDPVLVPSAQEHLQS